ncbi:hypothetical protein [Saccharopolyspora hattusasensis]|uniref:hypothetical protein n=1 Tax=Saccharopolyspora hattusasensis TaxID=1128679 RepID=UPI003D97C0B3
MGVEQQRLGVDDAFEELPSSPLRLCRVDVHAAGHLEVRQLDGVVDAVAGDHCALP